MQTFPYRNANELLPTQFAELLVEHELTYQRRADWYSDTQLKEVPSEFKVVSMTKTTSINFWIITDGPCYVSLAMYARSNYIELIVATKYANRAKADAWYDKFRKLMPRTKPKKDKVPFQYWYWHHKDGAVSAQRLISAPIWDNVRKNYSGGTQEQLDNLIGWQPNTGGQLILWHGVPGTGKTYAIQALSQAWRDWADFEYVTDPEEFFGRAGYMMGTLLGDGDNDNQEKWKVLVLEDCGEMLHADAKMREGQKLARLLNLVDGLIGKGLQILLLITTNEKLGDLHTAVARPGRCASLIEFNSLSQAEANAWLETNGASARVHNTMPLSDLYSMLSEDDGLRRINQQQGMGFTLVQN